MPVPAHPQPKTLADRPYAKWAAILIAAVLIAYFLFVFMPFSETTTPGTAPTLAVLPFVSDLYGYNDRMASGLANDLLTRLQYFAGLQCVPRAQVLALETADLTPGALARRLGAEIVITGMVRERNGRIELALLIDDARAPTPNVNLEITQSSEALFDLQRHALDQVIDTLGIAVTQYEMTLAHRQPTRSLKAWSYSAQGQLYLDDWANPRAAGFAQELFQRAIQLDPDFSQARSGLAESLWLQHLRIGGPVDLESAEHEGRAAVMAHPMSSSAAVTLAKIRQWQAPSEVADWGPLIEFDHLAKPDEAMRQLAVALLQAGELGMAEAAWRSTIEKRDVHWLNWYAFGYFLQRSGRFAEAEAAFLEADALSPDRVSWPKESILRLRLVTGDIDAALSWFETIGADLSDSELLQQIGAGYASLDRWSEAERVLRQSLSLDFGNVRLRQQLGEALLSLDRTEDAQAQFQEALITAELELGSDPQNPAHQSRFALLAAQAGLCTRALPVATTLRRHLPESTERLLDLTRVFAICGDHELALESLRVALQFGLSPHTVWATHGLESLATDPDFQQLMDAAAGIPPSP